MAQIPAKTHKDQLVVVPGHVSATLVPGSPVAHDTLGAGLRSLTIETSGAGRVELWRSVNAPDSATPATDPAITWAYVGEAMLPEPGLHSLRREVVADLASGRYIKVDRTHGKADKVHFY